MKNAGTARQKEKRDQHEHLEHFASPLWLNEPVEKVTFLKSASSVGSKIEKYHLFGLFKRL